MPLQLSAYHLIKYILDNDTNENKNKMNQIARIFKNRIPDSLLRGLSKQNEELAHLCEEHRKQIDLANLNKETTRETQIRKHNEWRERCDENNSRQAESARKIRAEKQAKQQAEKQAKTSQDIETYITRMQPVFDEHYAKILKQREEDLKVALNPPK